MRGAQVGPNAATSSGALPRHRARCAAATLRAALVLLALPRAAAPAAMCCLEVQLLTPYLTADAPLPGPGTRFEAAKARALRCAPEAACAGEDVSLQPSAALAASVGATGGDLRPFSLIMRLLVPADDVRRAWPDETEARGPPPGALLPAGTWTHFAGDSLLRGVFGTLSQYVRQSRWEQWKGVPAQRSDYSSAQQHASLL
jgi:hypothetical protein